MDSADGGGGGRGSVCRPPRCSCCILAVGTRGGLKGPPQRYIRAGGGRTWRECGPLHFQASAGGTRLWGRLQPRPGYLWSTTRSGVPGGSDWLMVAGLRLDWGSERINGTSLLLSAECGWRSLTAGIKSCWKTT